MQSNSDSCPAASASTAPPPSHTLASSSIPDFKVRAHYALPSSRPDAVAPVSQQRERFDDSAPFHHHPYSPEVSGAGDRHTESNEVKWDQMACDSISVARILTLPFRDRRVPREIAEGVVDRAQRHINAAMDAYPHCSSAVQEVIKANMDELLLVIANLMYDAVGVEQLVRSSDSQLLRDSSQKTPPSRSTLPPVAVPSLSGDRIKLLLGWINDNDYIDMDIRNVSPETIFYLHNTQLSDVRGLVRKCMELTAMYMSQNGADVSLFSHAQIQCEKATLWCNQLTARFKAVQTHLKCNVPTTHVDDLASISSSNREQEVPQISETGQSLQMSGHPLDLAHRSGKTPRPMEPTVDPSVSFCDLSGTAKRVRSPANQKTDADRHSLTETGLPPLYGALTKSNVSQSADASDPVYWCEPLRLQLDSQFRALDPLVWAGFIPDKVQSRVAHIRPCKLLPCASVDPHLSRTKQRDSLHGLEGNSLAIGPRTVFDYHYASTQMQFLIFEDQVLLMCPKLDLFEGRDLMPHARLPPLQDRGTPTRWVWKPGILSHSRHQASTLSTLSPLTCFWQMSHVNVL
jgi:hypothetical protein